MKVISLPAAFVLTSFFAHTTAYFSLGPFPSVVQIGQNYTLNWTATLNYTYNLWLIVENPGGNEFSWTEVLRLGQGLRFGSLNAGYTWTVPSNLSVQRNYGLWLTGFPIPFNGASYTNMTEWFRVSSSRSSTSSGSTSTIVSATASTSPTMMTSATSSGIPTSDHHRSISGGAIAGIVVGCLVAIALMVGAGLLFIWRRRQSAVRRREAEARAGRLEPVMQESSPAYEMQSRKPKAIK